MPKRKLEIKATDEQLEAMYQTLRTGAPLELALQKIAVSKVTYYYWCAIASIVTAIKSQEEMEEIEEITKSGISLQNIRDMVSAESKTKKTNIGVFIEPTAEQILLYKNSVKFRKFANRCYEIVTKCDFCRAEFATKQLAMLSYATNLKNKINPSPSMWWLERNMPDFFAKATDKAKENENAEPIKVPSIEVEFIEPNTNATRQRLLDMEETILKDMKGGPKA